MPRSAVYMFIASILFGVMGMFVKLASRTVPPFEIVFFRSFLAWLITALYMAWQQIPATGHNRTMLLIRSIFGCGSMICYFYAISTIPLVTAVMLTYTSPVFVTILAVLVLREAVTSKTTGALLLSLGGVYLILKPELHLEWGAVAGLSSSFLFAVALIAIKIMSDSDPPWVVVYHFTLFSSLVAAPLLLLGFRLPHVREAIYIIGVAVPASLAQILMTAAYQRGKASTGSVISLTTAVVSASLGVLVLGEGLDGRALLGGLIIMGSSVYLAWQGRETRPALDPP